MILLVLWYPSCDIRWWWLYYFSTLNYTATWQLFHFVELEIFCFVTMYVCVVIHCRFQIGIYIYIRMFLAQLLFFSRALSFSNVRTNEFSGKACNFWDQLNWEKLALFFFANLKHIMETASMSNLGFYACINGHKPWSISN